MTDCEKRNINCPPRYKNIGSANFGDEKKVTAEMLYQFCKNDSYLYDQIKKLWDKTDPEHRKRFYAPYYMDGGKSYGIEPLIFDEDSRMYNNKVSTNDINNKLTKPNGKIENAYHLSNTLREKYLIDFDYTNDKTYWEINSNSEYDTLVFENDNLIEDNSTLNVMGYELDDGRVIHTVLPLTTSKPVSGEIPFTLYKTPVKDDKKVVKVKKVTKKDVYGKLTLDANCDGPYHNWHSNSVWYIGYNRHKNYNVKNSWRKNLDDTTIPSVCRGQTFKAEHSGELLKVVLLMKGSSKSVSPCIVEIRTVGKNGKPTNKVLARTEQKFNHSSKTLVNFIFKKPCKVKKGTQYAIVIRSPLSNFNHCYWIGGWASTCFSNNRKRAYYNGETFLSEDNGKTWITHGKKEKCYGSHYYDWGFAEAPVNFGFEVYIAPKTGTKSVTSYVPKTVGSQTSETVKVTDYKTASIDLTYYEAGIYYLEFKPFVGNFYTDVTCIYSITPYEEGTNIGEYSWEIFNSDINEETEKVYGWQSFNDYAKLYGTEGANSSYSLTFPKALTFVKLRLKLKLEENVLENEENFKANFERIVQDLLETQGIVESEVTEWIINVESYFGWKTVEEEPLDIRTINNLEFQLGKKPSFNGYLRTLEYHPVQEGMLPACIWSEVDADIIPKNKGTVEVDIVHEQTAIEHILFYKPTNTALEPYIINYMMEVEGNSNVGDSLGYSGEDILKYIVKIDTKGTDNDGVIVYNDVINKPQFIEYLQSQTPKVYLLPYRVTETIENEETGEDEEVFKRYVYFFGEDTADVTLDSYPSYPINSCSIGTENIELNLSQNINSKIVKKDETQVSYTHNTDLTDMVKDIQICYKYNNPETGEIVTEFQKLEENDDYSINEDTIIFNVTENNLLNDYINIGEEEITVKENGYINVGDTSIVFEMASYEYNEFQNYIVDYENKVFHFYEPLGLVEGEMTINYNPLWVRGLSPDDFPLKMDLWTEYYQVLDGGTDENGKQMYIFEKCKLNECGKPVIEDNVENPIGEGYIQTSVSPLDNIREIDIQDNDLNSLLVEPLVEDEDYSVDYLTNRITFTYIGLKIGNVVMVKYTPNLVDNGLSLGYRLRRPLYDVYDNEITETILVDKTSKVNNDLEDGDDVFCLSNYFTTRT